MAIIQTPWAKGVQTPPRPHSHGSVHVVRVPFDLAAQAVTTADIVEMTPLNPFAVPVDAVLLVEGAFTGTVDIGLMSGEAGNADVVRTSGNELFEAQSIASPGAFRLNKVAAFKLVATEVERGIGLKFSANQAIGAGKLLTLILHYRQ